MKKILAIVTMAAMVAGAAFADPEADFNIAEVSGSASVTWGVDLDNQTTGFKNDTSAKLKVNLVNSGSKSTEGEGIWAELAVKLADPIQYVDGAWNGKDVSIDVAKLHFYNFYVGIKSGDTLVGEFNVPNAVYSSKVGVSNVNDPDHDQGIVIGYGDNKNVSFEVDFRSVAAGDVYYTNDYGVAAELKLLDSNEFLNGMFVTAGFDYQFDAKAMGIAASAGYKAKLNDTYYVKPTVGFTMAKTGDADATMNLAAGLLFGWGDEKDANAGVPYLCDETKKVTPGVGVAAVVPLAEGSTIKLFPSIYTGELVKDLTAAALAEIDIPSAGDLSFGVVAGLKYAIAVNDAVTVTPSAGIRFNKGASTDAIFADACQANLDNGGLDDTQQGGDALFNVKVGVDVAGLINNTTFSVDWTSRDLMGNDDTSKIGTVNVTCKISF